MATRAHSTNVLKLPTAAPRKVINPANAAARAFRASNPWPGEYVMPQVRAMEQLEQALPSELVGEFLAFIRHRSSK